jgi:serine/threonine protein kinase
VDKVSEELEPGTVFAGYTIERVLGVGAMGTVYLAAHPRLPKSVALKLLHRSLTSDENLRLRFESEADHAARLEHPNIVAVYDRGRDGNQMWIAMQYVDSVDAALPLQSGPLDVRRAVQITTEVARALDYAHQKGVLHRDVKPANILIAASTSGGYERVLLTDFGIAKALDDSGHLTKTGMLVATLFYAAPEQIQGIALDHRADVYSLGCTLFHLITGTVPYPGPYPAAVMHGHLNMAIPRASELRPALPTVFDDVIARALAKNRDDRYGSCGALGADARRALEATAKHPTGRTDHLPARNPDPKSATELSPQWYEQARGHDSQATQWGPTQIAPTAPGSFTSGPAPPLFQPEQRVRPHTAWWRRSSTSIIATVTSVLAIAAIVTWSPWQPGNRETTAQTSVTTPPSPLKIAPAQVLLPFAGLKGPHGVAVNTVGDVFVTDSGNNRVLKLPAGSNNPLVLPFTGLGNPVGLAVNTVGDVFVADWDNFRVLRLPAGSGTPIAVPIAGLYVPIEAAVNITGDLFVTDLNNQVLKLPAGSDTPIVLPFNGLDYPHGVGVNAVGDVFVADSNNNRVLKLSAGAPSATAVPFTGLNFPVGLAVSNTGDVYVTDWANRRVLKLSSGHDSPITLRFNGLSTPAGVAVSSNGDVFVTDSTNNWVVKLPAGG